MRGVYLSSIHYSFYPSNHKSFDWFDLFQHRVTTLYYTMLYYDIGFSPSTGPLQYGLSEWLSHGGVAVAAMTIHQAWYICDGGCFSNYIAPWIREWEENNTAPAAKPNQKDDDITTSTYSFNTSTLSTSTAASSSNDETENFITPAKPYSGKGESSAPTPFPFPSEPSAFQSEVMTALSNLASSQIPDKF